MVGNLTADLRFLGSRLAALLMAVTGTFGVVGECALGQCGTFAEVDQTFGQVVDDSNADDRFAARRVFSQLRDNGIVTLAVAQGRFVRVYEKPETTGTWQLVSTIEAPAEAFNFGHAIAISKNTFTAPGGGGGQSRYYMFIGAPRMSAPWPVSPDGPFSGGWPEQGAVYVYRSSGSGWSFDERIDPSPGDGGRSESFGASVAIGNCLLIGVPYKTDGCGTYNLGQVSVYELSSAGWVQDGNLRQPVEAQCQGSANNRKFGEVLAADGSEMYASMYGTPYRYTFTGTPPQFGYVSEQAIYDNGVQVYNPKSFTVDASANLMVIGYRDYQAGGSRGAAAVYSRTNSASPWAFESLLNPVEPRQPGQSYGDTVAIVRTPVGGTGRFIAVSRLAEPDASVSNSNLGGVNVFEKVGGLWQDTDYFEPSALASGLNALRIRNHATAAGRWLFVSGDFMPIAGSEEVGGVAAYFHNTQGTFLQPQTLRRSMLESARCGSAIAADGNYLVLGAPTQTSAAGSSTGAVYVMKWESSGWTPVPQELRWPTRDGDAQFGQAVAISGDYLAVGCPQCDSTGSPQLEDSGAVFIYKRQTASSDIWMFDQRIDFNTTTGSEVAAGDRFGSSLWMRGANLMVGIPFDDNQNGVDAGSAYEYVRDAAGVYVPTRSLLANDGTAGDNFGISVSFGPTGTIVANDTYAVVGSYADDPQGTNSGSAYIFKITPIIGGPPVWAQQAKLTQPGGAAGDNFGYRVLFNPTLTTPNSATLRVVVSSVVDDTTGGIDAGSVHVFRQNAGSWILEQTIFPADAEAGEWFGSSIAIRGTNLIVGAARESAAGLSQAGAAYWFQRSGNVWSFVRKIVASDRATNDRFGTAAAFSNGRMVFGVPQNDISSATDVGAIYTYEEDARLPLLDPLDATTVRCPGTGSLQVLPQAGGPAIATYAWQYFDGTNWQTMSANTTYSFGHVSGFLAGGALVQFAQLVAGSSTQMRCVATNACGSTISTTTALAVDSSVPVQFVSQPQDQRVCSESQSLAFTANVIGGSGVLEYVWIYRVWTSSNENESFFVSSPTPSASISLASFINDNRDRATAQLVIADNCSTHFSEEANITADLPWQAVVQVLYESPGSCPMVVLGISSADVWGVPDGVTLQWRRNGTVIAGETGHTLTVGSYEPLGTQFDCVSTSSCRVLASNAYTVVQSCEEVCASIDFNNDGAFFDPQDIEAYLSVFSEGPCIPETAVCNSLDFNVDGSIFDPCDIDSYLLVFSEGPCTLCGQ
jgi:hypothetical protein